MTQIPPLWNAKVSEVAQKDRRRRAFNLLELLVVMLLIGLMAAVTLSSLGKTLPRYKLRGKATEVSGFFQKARLAAIKSGLDVSVEIEEMGNSEQALIAYRNNIDGTQTELYRLMAGSPIRPFDPYLGGVAGASVDAAKTVTFAAGKVVYKPTGNAAETGAIRVSIGQDSSMNTIEVAISSLGGQPVLRKYTAAGDLPPGAPIGQEFFKETHFGTKWQWVWY